MSISVIDVLITVLRTQKHMLQYLQHVDARSKDEHKDARLKIWEDDVNRVSSLCDDLVSRHTKSVKPVKA